MGRVGPDAESRRVVTVLFCDVVGSTSITEGDPEVARRVITNYFEVLRDVIVRHGGMVEKFIGDEVMAVYGVPQAHEDDALRAARSAVEIREAVASLGTRLSIRVGINTGEVVAGDHSAGHGFLTGDAVVVGKRLAESARRGEILIGDATFSLVRDAVVTEDPAELQVKGKSAPVGARRLLAVIADAPGVRRRPGGELVGRERELALLRHAFEGAAAHSRGHLFTVLGPAGVGKSRLVRELVAEVDDRATVLGGRCLAYGEGITYWPLLDVVRQAAAISPQVTPDEARTQIARLLGDDREADAIASLVAGAVGLTDTPASTQETFCAFRKLLEAIARDRPLVLIFDDLHWAERTFLDLVGQLGDATRDQPILIVCLARPELLELRPAWGGGYVNASSVLIEPLEREEAARLIDGLTDESLDEAARQTIIRAAEGNPLFIEEMVAAARESGAVSVTPTIQALLATRLDRLPPEERAAIEAAAVAGQSFNGRAVLALTGDEDLAGRLESLARKELIRQQRDSSPEDPWFRFRHILIKDAAYDALPKARRSQLHERFADWLERDMGERVREVEEILGYHLEQAHLLRVEIGLPADPSVASHAGRLLSAAGGRALGREDMRAARRLLERASTLLRADDPARPEALRRLAAALWATGEFARAEAMLDEVIGAAVVSGDRRTEWSARLARAGFHPGSGEIETTAAHAIGVFEELGDDLGLARARRRLAFSAMTAGRHAEAEREARLALEHARRAGDRAEEARAADILCMSLLNGPTAAEAAVDECERLLADASGSILLEATLTSALAPLYALSGRRADAEATADHVRARFDDVGNALARAGLSQMLGLTALLLEDPVTAERELRPTLDVLPPLAQAPSLVLLAEALQAQGRLGEAEALAAGTQATDTPTRVRLAIVRARLAAPADLDAALAHAEAAVDLAARLDEPNLQADALRALSEAQAARGATAQAQELLAEAAALYEAKGNVPAAGRARAALVSGVAQR